MERRERRARTTHEKETARDGQTEEQVKAGRLTKPKIGELDKQLQRLTRDFSTSSEKAEELASKVAETSRELETLGRDLAANQDVADSLTEALETNNARIQTLADEIALFKAEMEKDLPKVDPKNDGGAPSLTENLAVTNRRLESFETELNRVNESLLHLSSEGRNVHEKLGEQDVGISEARARIEAVANDSVPRITNQLESFARDFQGWGDKISTLTEAVSAISPIASSGGNGTAPGATEQLLMINQRVDNLEKLLSQTNIRIEELQGNVAALAKRVTAVEIDTAVASADAFREF
jgi:chromosome segregation ATPase